MIGATITLIMLRYFINRCIAGRKLGKICSIKWRDKQQSFKIFGNRNKIR
jgi:hypothetical protein